VSCFARAFLREKTYGFKKNQQKAENPQPYSIFIYMGYKGNKILQAKKSRLQIALNYFSTGTLVTGEFLNPVLRPYLVKLL
jgi:hypothetical protein